MKHLQQKKELSRRKTEVLVSIAFTLLMFLLSWSEVVYIPISDDRIMDLSLVPVVFAAMIGGYMVAIPVGIGWGIVTCFNSLGVIYDWYWIILVKLSFPVSLVYFYSVFKKGYYQSPWNVHRTIIAAVVLKNLIVGMAMATMFPETTSAEWARDNMAAFVIELAVSLLAMSLLVEKLRKIHILNGVRRKEKEESNKLR